MTHSVRQLKIGGGGLLRDIAVSDDGTMLLSPDTYGTWVSDGVIPWRDIVNTTSMPADVWTVQYATAMAGWTGQAPYESAIYKLDSNRIYLMLDLNVYRSEDGGETFVETNFPAGPNYPGNSMLDTSQYSNHGTHRAFNKRMTIDPQNPDHLFIGQPDNGVSYSHDGGDTYTAISTSTIPLSDPGFGTVQYPILMAFDPNSATSSGRKQGIYVHSNGNGLYRSTNGGTSWSAVSGAPLWCAQLKVAQDGYVYFVATTLVGAAEQGYGTLWVYSGSAWTETTQDFVVGVAFDPDTAGRLVVVDTDSDMVVSTDHGATWTTKVASVADTSATIPWLGLTSGGNPFNYGGYPVFHPIDGMVYVATGLGVIRCTPPAPGDGVEYVDFSLGIENMNTRQIIYPPGGNIVCTVWDQGVFRVTNPNLYTATKGITQNPVALGHGWGIDFCAGTPDYIAVLINAAGGDVPADSGYSLDGGATWSLFDTAPTNYSYATGCGAGGNIAVSTGTGVDETDANICVIGSDNGVLPNQITYTTDGGTTWQTSSLPGIPTHGRTGWSNHNSAGTYAICSDRVTEGTFYAFNVSANVNVLSGTYNSGTGEVTLTLTHPFGLVVGHQYDITIVTGTGSFSYCNGVQTATTGSTGATLKFIIATGLTMTITGGAGGDQCYNKYPRGIWRSTDGGANFTRVFSGTGVTGMDTGNYGGGRKLKSVPGNAGHLFFTMGQASQCPLLRSTNGGTSWTAVTDMMEAWDIGFGAVADGETYPGIVVPGWYDGVWGWWYSADECVTWTSIVEYPYNSYNIMFCVTGDPVVPGKFYMGQNSNGFLILDPEPLTEYVVNWGSA